MKKHVHKVLSGLYYQKSLTDFIKHGKKLQAGGTTGKMSENLDGRARLRSPGPGPLVPVPWSRSPGAGPPVPVPWCRSPGPGPRVPWCRSPGPGPLVPRSPIPGLGPGISLFAKMLAKS